jgi:hypothetical protein
VNLADELEDRRAAAIDDAKDVYDVQDRLCAFYDALTPERQREADAIIVSWLVFREDTRTGHCIVNVRWHTGLCLVTSLSIATAIPALFALANRFAKNTDPGSVQQAAMVTRIATEMSARPGLRFSIFPARTKPATEASRNNEA